MKRKLIVTAHDFGLCPSVNEGVLYCLAHPNNLISEISILPNFPASPKAASLIKRRDCSVSLNTNFTSGRPLSSPVKSLVDKDGNFRRVDVATWDFSAIDEFDEEDIVKELGAQWDWFLKHLGRKPSAILSRKNEHGDPKILLPVTQLAKRQKVPIRTPVWRWQENYGAQSYVEQEEVRSSQHIFIGLRDWQGRFGYDLVEDIDRLIDDIYASQGICELLVFPGFVDEELFKMSSLNWQRGQFLKILDNQVVVNKIKNNFDLISFSDL